MKKHIPISLLIVLSLAFQIVLKAQIGIPENSYFHFTGKMNGKYSIEMDLIKIGDSLYGTLSPVPDGNLFSPSSGNGVSMPLTLYGKVDAPGNLSLKENPWGKGAAFHGKLADNRTFKGSWTSRDGKLKVPFELAETYAGGTVSFDVYYQHGALLLTRKKDSPKASFQFGYLSPKGPAGPVMDSIMKLIAEKYSGKQANIKDPGMILKSMKNDYFSNYLETNKSIYEESMGASFNWESLKFMNILMNCHNLLAFYIEEYSFTGGAHGLQTRENCVVNLRTGKQATLSDIFREGYEIPLAEILTRKVRESHKIGPDKKLTDSGFFVESITPSGNFYLTVNGVGFYYNHYEIAPYSEGPDDIFIPYHEIREILLSSGITQDLPGYSTQP